MLAEPGKSPNESLGSDSDSYNGEYSDYGGEFYDDQEMGNLPFPKQKKEPEELLKELPEELRAGALKNLQPL